jgi:hypothetical protein
MASNYWGHVSFDWAELVLVPQYVCSDDSLFYTDDDTLPHFTSLGVQVP